MENTMQFHIDNLEGIINDLLFEHAPSSVQDLLLGQLEECKNKLKDQMKQKNKDTYNNYN
mgnify:FL=1